MHNLVSNENQTDPTFIESRREELMDRFGEKLNPWKFLENPITPTEVEQRNEIIESKPKVVKVFCEAGKNRSAYVVDLLNQRGYEADNSGVGGATPYTAEDLTKKYDALIFATEDIMNRFFVRLNLLGIENTFDNIPKRVLNFEETGKFYLDRQEKEQALAQLKPKVEQALDRLGFIDKKEIQQ